MTALTLEQGASRLKGLAAQLATTQEILATIQGSENPVFIDDHRSSAAATSLNNYVLVEHDGQLCPFPMNNGSCLNPLYIGEDGKVHLSRWSIGGYYDSLQSLDAAGRRYYTI